MTLLYTIAFIIIFYYVFKFGIRLLLPFLVKKLSDRLMKKAQQGQGGFTYTSFGTGGSFTKNQGPFDQYKKPDGKVKVDYVPESEEKGKGRETAGEFIEFEEIK